MNKEKIKRDKERELLKKEKESERENGGKLTERILSFLSINANDTTHSWQNRSRWPLF